MTPEPDVATKRQLVRATLAPAREQVLDAACGNLFAQSALIESELDVVALQSKLSAREDIRLRARLGSLEKEFEILKPLAQYDRVMNELIKIEKPNGCEFLKEISDKRSRVHEILSNYSQEVSFLLIRAERELRKEGFELPENFAEHAAYLEKSKHDLLALSDEVASEFTERLSELRGAVRRNLQIPMLGIRSRFDMTGAEKPEVKRFRAMLEWIDLLYPIASAAEARLVRKLEDDAIIAALRKSNGFSYEPRRKIFFDENDDVRLLSIYPELTTNALERFTFADFNRFLAKNREFLKLPHHKVSMQYDEKQNVNTLNIVVAIPFNTKRTANLPVAMATQFNQKFLFDTQMHEAESIPGTDGAIPSSMTSLMDRAREVERQIHEATVIPRPPR